MFKKFLGEALCLLQMKTFKDNVSCIFCSFKDGLMIHKNFSRNLKYQIKRVISQYITPQQVILLIPLLGCQYNEAPRNISFNTMRPRQNDHYLASDIYFVSKLLYFDRSFTDICSYVSNNNPTLIQITGVKLFSKPVMGIVQCRIERSVAPFTNMA